MRKEGAEPVSRLQIRLALGRACKELEKCFPTLTWRQFAAGVRWALLQDPDNVPDPKPVNGTERLLKAREAAAWLGISERSLWSLVSGKKLEPVRLHRRMARFREVDLVNLSAGRSIVVSKELREVFSSPETISRETHKTREACVEIQLMLKS